MGEIICSNKIKNKCPIKNQYLMKFKLENDNMNLEAKSFKENNYIRERFSRIISTDI